MSTNTAAPPAPKSFARRDYLRENEKRVQKKWLNANANESIPKENQEKYMVTFPYPYMNGRLHLGHAFSWTKAEFTARYQKMLGKNVLLPFGFHCTGMPIQAAANKLKEEIQTFGCPPVFPDETPKEEDNKVEEKDAAAAINAKSKGKKTKLAVKGQSGPVRQWDILAKMVPVDEIPLFQDPEHWLKFFPPLGVEDLMAFGSCIDWRRSFITTSAAPYYDAFIRWQFNLLKEGGKIKSGFRPNIYSVKDQQVCADHDRASGETVGPQEYTIIKLQVLARGREDGSSSSSPLVTESVFDNKLIFLAAATLRPETMYGQTNCYVLPDGEYGAYEFVENEVWIMSDRAAKGLAHQGFAKEWGKYTCLAKMKGWDLLGLPLKAPNSTYERVYTLPLLTITMNKGTGVVTSVPSDAPDDYIALKEMKEKPQWREKFFITASMVESYEVVPIIEIPGYGTTSAATLCEQRDVKSSKDSEKLKAIKDEVYLKGFYEGIMLVGECQGMKVCDAKPVIRQSLIAQNLAIPYFEPESTVMSRSGDECIVALTDQWYLAYGESSWQEAVANHILSANFNSFNAGILESLNKAVNWLKEWACSREFGLGTKLPWDPKWVIDSLSDSTIYMAYYTVAHYFHADPINNLAGSSGVAGIDASDMTDEIWSFIFLNKPLPENFQTKIPMETLENMRKEFLYWYPMDLRVSAKDLIPNHLTMCLYNHAEIWKDQPSLWPKGIYCNGHIMVNAEKMSKSKGNFLLMKECVEEYTADATRFALADAGDSLEDANFDRAVSNQAISYLFVEEEWVNAFLQDEKDGKLRNTTAADWYFMDKAFDNEINYLVEETKKHFSNMNYREGLHTGWYDMIIARDQYRDWSIRSNIPMNVHIVRRFIEALVLMISPICPHWSELIYEKFHGEAASVTRALWPQVGHYDPLLRKEYLFLRSFMKNIRLSMSKTIGNKVAGKKLAARIFVASKHSEKKMEVLKYMQSVATPEGACKFPETFSKDLKAFLMGREDLKPEMMLLMQFGMFMKGEAEEQGHDALSLTLPYDQLSILGAHEDYMKAALELETLTLVDLDGNSVEISNSDKKKAAEAVPGKPSFVVEIMK